MWIIHLIGHTTIDETGSDTIEELCPHCGGRNPLERRRLTARLLHALPIRQGDAFVCVACGGISTRTSAISRIAGALVLLPVFLIVVTAGLLGGYGVYCLLQAGAWETPIAVMSGLLLLVSGYFGRAMLHAVGRLIRPSRLVRMNASLERRCSALVLLFRLRPK